MGLRLAIDVGNTKTKFAIFDGKKLVHNGQMIKFTLDDLLALGKEHGVSYVIISSVKHLNKDIKQLIASDTSYFLLSHTMNLPFKIEYKT
ncbi:MAG: type III pantothenate kinase, partial [Saprospiraceae bacterium]|nr:type III pantothenate kinase [Saprospiraceae bacterium]